ncbi:carboxypeptidase regulatory-like domain-containing protein [Paenibacillus thalictri]|uniref:Carboxypeptidase regulatory-like domain-containing protein n=1 Tax=Paenibacillus thalictri TaxID=2527873 RepID=A0A4Q9DGU3_9BACL|nr:carboxypeptidase regulatory-like domain-containing protein [Paenibacillus thalictri]TBL70497.1 carboxypeptidase regulatory-like domain-containing protein [Paenibacillus thalictri]
MKSINKTTALLAIAALFGGCSAQSPHNAASPAPSEAVKDQAHTAQIQLDEQNFTLKQWKVDGSHITTVKGTLLLDNQPVTNGILHASSIKRDIVTGEDGAFALTVDQSLLADTQVKVKSLDQATFSGKPLTSEMTKDLLAAETRINVNYPIQVKQVENSPEDPAKVKVHGQVLSGSKDDVISFFQVDKYRIGGVVKDADGKPVQNAVVWFDRDEGEGFGKSTPTDENGTYSIYYMPEDEETNLSVTLGTTRYTLPEGKVFVMPEKTSVQIDITLPRQGTIIEDKPPTLVSVTSPGAIYTGVLVGLNVPKDVEYTVTIPDKQGNFVVTLPKQVWEQQKPAFFETKISKFVDNIKLTWGDTLPPNFIEPSDNDPKLTTTL